MNNNMGKGSYIAEHILWSGITLLGGRTLLFRSIPGCTYLESVLIFLGMDVLVTGLGIFLTLEKGRNYVNLISNILFSQAALVCVAYGGMFQRGILGIAIVAGSVSLCMSIPVLFRKIRNPAKREKIIRRRLENVRILWRRSFTWGALALLVPVSCSVLFRGTVLNAELNAVKVYREEHSLEANLDVLCELDAEKWEKLDLHRKLQVCSKVVRAEAYELGISHEINIGTADLKAGTVACYSESKHQIVMDRTYLETACSWDILQSVLHEVCHAYQFELVHVYTSLDEKVRSLQVFAPASQYLEEFADYENGQEDYLNYYRQQSETDARNFAEEKMAVYREKIQECL